MRSRRGQSCLTTRSAAAHARPAELGVREPMQQRLPDEVRCVVLLVGVDVYAVEASAGELPC